MRGTFTDRDGTYDKWKEDIETRKRRIKDLSNSKLFIELMLTNQTLVANPTKEESEKFDLLIDEAIERGLFTKEESEILYI